MVAIAFDEALADHSDDNALKGGLDLLTGAGEPEQAGGDARGLGAGDPIVVHRFQQRLLEQVAGVIGDGAADEKGAGSDLAGDSRLLVLSQLDSPGTPTPTPAMTAAVATIPPLRFTGTAYWTIPVCLRGITNRICRKLNTHAAWCPSLQAAGIRQKLHCP